MAFTSLLVSCFFSGLLASLQTLSFFLLVCSLAFTPNCILPGYCPIQLLLSFNESNAYLRVIPQQQVDFCEFNAGLVYIVRLFVS